MALKFGTSGVRGLVTEMTDLECYLYTRAFVQYVRASGPVEAVSLAGDLRPSTPRIIEAVAYALLEERVGIDYCGFISTTAVTYHAMSMNRPSIMVTGSHIPGDRNGIKFNMPWGEVLKRDETVISELYHKLKSQERAVAESFSPTGNLKRGKGSKIPVVNKQAEERYFDRYQAFFASGGLQGLRLVVYQHSSVSRDILGKILESLGAVVMRVGRSDDFVPVDTEAVANPVEIAQWIRKYEADALASTDGDGDRPLLFNENGEQIRGDVMGVLTSEFLGADSVSVPVSCSSGVERSRFFENVYRTRIGSPFVISSMLEAVRKGYKTVVGFEANGGFLTASDIVSAETGQLLAALPTRDAILPIVGVLRRSVLRNQSLSQQVSELPAVFTSSGLIKSFANELGHSLVRRFEAESSALANLFFRDTFGELISIDFTDGARMTFKSGDVVHLRPSGNAPEFRCYTESSSQEAADQNNRTALKIVETVIRPFLEMSI